MKHKIATAVYAVALFFLILTFSIGLPIYCRFFYFWQIGALGIEADSGFSRDVIVEAYNELLNYLTLGTPFGTGQLRYSESGYQHFVDCKVLFDLNLWGFIVSFCAVVCVRVLEQKKIVRMGTVAGLRPELFVGIAAIVLPLAIGALAAADFDRAFVVFHKIFFPGKDNWIFDYREDQIIGILPEQFFLNCAILIGVSVIVWAVGCVVYALMKRRARNLR